MVSSTKRKQRPASTDIATLTESLGGRLHALVVCLSRSWGGLEQVAAQDCIELGKQGLDVWLLCLKDTPIEKELKNRTDVKVYPIDFKPRNYFDFKLRKILKQFIQEKNINLIHTHQTSLLGSISPWLWNQPHVSLLASRHIMNNHNKRNLFHAMIYRRLDAYVVMSQVLQQNVLQTHVLREKQIKVIHLGLDFNAFDPDKIDPTRQRAAWGATSKTIVIGLVGRIDPAKGQAVFIQAAAGLLKKGEENLESNLKFVIVGEETKGSQDNYLNELKEMVEQFRLQKYVVFAGFQQNIPEVMSAFDIFVMPSRQEAFGLVAIEAMAMKCPIIISRGGSADEIVGSQEFGLLVRPESAFDLQQQLSYLIENPRLRNEMGRKARDHVVRSYDRKVRLQKTLELYERCLRRRRQ